MNMASNDERTDEQLKEQASCYAEMWNPEDPENQCQGCSLQPRCLHAVATKSFDLVAAEFRKPVEKISTKQFAKTLETSDKAIEYALAYRANPAIGLPIIGEDGVYRPRLQVVQDLPPPTSQASEEVQRLLAGADEIIKGVEEAQDAVEEKVAEQVSEPGVEDPKPHATHRSKVRSTVTSKKKTTKKKKKGDSKFTTETRERQSLMRKVWWAEKRSAAGNEEPGDKTRVKKITKKKAGKKQTAKKPDEPQAPAEPIVQGTAPEVAPTPEPAPVKPATPAVPAGGLIVNGGTSDVERGQWGAFPPLFATEPPIYQLVFWNTTLNGWIYLVARRTGRELPEGVYEMTPEEWAAIEARKSLGLTAQEAHKDMMAGEVKSG